MKTFSPGKRALAVGCALTVAGVGLAGAASAAPRTAAHQKISTVKIDIGRVLSDQNGRVLYLFEKDARNKSNCGKPCRQVWPLVKSTGSPVAGAHVSASHLGRLANGEVTYYGHPLYYYVGDTKPKQDNGQGQKQFGAEWYVVGTNGHKIDES